MTSIAARSEAKYRLSSFPSPVELSDAIADAVAAAVYTGVKNRRTASLAVSGGSTPRLYFPLVAGLDLPWDCVFSSETFHHYKPDPEMYLGAADVLDVRPSEVMMVASHKHDLRSAAKYGSPASRDAFSHR